MSLLSRLLGGSQVNHGSYLPLLAKSITSVVGESHYQAVINKTRLGASSKPPLPVEGWPLEISKEERLPWFTAYLEREPDNPHDPKAVRVSSTHGCLGYLPAATASGFQRALKLAEEAGHRGGSCSAFMRQADNGMWGVVLAVSGGKACADRIKHG